jgi:hypothetical protein
MANQTKSAYNILMRNNSVVAKIYVETEYSRVLDGKSNASLRGDASLSLKK